MNLKIEMLDTPTTAERIATVEADRETMLDGLRKMEEYKILSTEESKEQLEKILATSRKQLSFLLRIDGAFGATANIEDLHRAVDSTWASFSDGRHATSPELNPSARDKSI